MAAPSLILGAADWGPGCNSPEAATPRDERSLLLPAGQSMGTTDLAIFGAGVLLALLYSYAFGGGDPGRERSWAIQLYSVGGLCLGAEVRGTPRLPPAPRPARVNCPADAALPAAPPRSAR